MDSNIVVIVLQTLNEEQEFVEQLEVDAVCSLDL
jgi:hypothetical protein